MRNDVNDLKKLVLTLINNEGGASALSKENLQLVRRLYSDGDQQLPSPAPRPEDTSVKPEAQPMSRVDHISTGALKGQVVDITPVRASECQDVHEAVEMQPLSIADNEKELIRRTLIKFKGNRRKTAAELQISERTLYRKIHDYGLDNL